MSDWLKLYIGTLVTDLDAHKQAMAGKDEIIADREKVIAKLREEIAKLEAEIDEPGAVPCGEIPEWKMEDATND